MQQKKRYTALIVDDSEMNREILKEMLADELDIVEIDNGNDACEYMMNYGNDLGIVILDLIMPGMDGFEVLRFMKYKHLIDQLPVIMISADSDGSNIEKAFDLGVIDFLSRPFSERIVLRRVMTTIRLFKRQKALIDGLDRQFKADDMRIDDLTGLDYKQTFYNKVFSHLQGDPTGRFYMIAVDVDHFKLFNNYYGWEEGDEYLRLVAKYLKEYTMRYGGIAGYLGGDDFAMFVPRRPTELMEFASHVWYKSELSKYEVGFAPKVGIYEIEDNTESVVSIYDNAKIALESIKDDYTKRLAKYDESMFQNVRNEYELLVDIKRGTEEGEFTFFVQHKVNMNSGKVVGGEALVRWMHKDKGMVSPAVFLPVLEKNGFISNIDMIVWESVVKWQRKWIDEGHRPVPISINVSRADIFT
ncbi:MAG: response regulator, partial [Lachnospiraceae bacterium]|nr:response regulator [Lachnospiraceae bacterium]